MSKLTYADLAPYLAAPEDPELEPFLESAAVLDAFDPLGLVPLRDRSVPAEYLERLLPHCEAIVDGPERGLFTLALGDRRAALQRLGTRDTIRRALAANPERVESAPQRMFERLLTGTDVALDGLAREELVGLIEVCRWLRDILPVPDEDAMQRALAQFDHLAPMRRLVGGFVNRRDELVHLWDFVNSGEQTPPLFVFGSGGVGKSTLLARFLLDHAEHCGGAFAYLDIDRPTLRPDAPDTLTLDAIDQLALQLELPSWVDAAKSRIAEGLRRRDSTRVYETSYRPGELPGIDLLRDLLNETDVQQRIVIVVDTFEEAQFLGSDVVEPLSHFLIELDRCHPAVRVVVSGRALAPEFAGTAFPQVFGYDGARAMEDHPPLEAVPLPARPINLGVLAVEPARVLLEREVAVAGLPRLRESDRDTVIEIVSRNPMCLRLAARLLRDEGWERFTQARSEVFAALRAEKIQGLLYGRVLNHIHTEDVKRIAYPGLIVRRITPEVIREVLAGPCELKLTPERDEWAIYWDLSQEAALVERDPDDDSVRHRPDVRRAMLEDLTDHVEPARVQEIDRAAVAFYSDRPGPVARAEELYHRMRLGQEAWELDQRWLPEAAPRLKNVGTEVGARQQMWLAPKLGVTLSHELREQAGEEEWEDDTAQSVENLLASGLGREAVARLDERTERLPRSPLFALEADAYRLLADTDAALRVARRGVQSAGAAGAIDLAVELLLKMVVTEEGRERYDEAAALAEEASGVAAHSTHTLLRLRAMVTTLRVDRRRHPSDHASRRELRESALAILTQDTVRELRSSPVLLREVAAELGKDHGGITATAIDTLGIEVETDAQAEALGHALASATEDAPHASSTVVHDAVEHFDRVDFDPNVVREWATKRVTGQDTRAISGALADATPGTQALRDFRAYFRAGVDSALRIE